MNKQSLPPERRTKGGKLFPALCNLLGTLMLVATIATCVPISLPHLMGYEIYNVVSPSMEPEIPMGSVIYVKYAPPETIEEGDVIAFFSADGVIAHRVVRNQTVEGEITTKGDANAAEDVNPVEYTSVIGRVTLHLPVLGGLMEIYTSTVGKIYLILFAACGAMLNLLAGRIRERRAYQKEQE